jgi:hypothetical protein
LRNAVSRDPEANVPETKVPEYREHETKAWVSKDNFLSFQTRKPARSK